MYKSKSAAVFASSSAEDVVLGGGTAVKSCVSQLEAVWQKRVYAAPQTFSDETARVRGRYYKACRRLKFSSESFLKY